ncbi:MAG TPA: tetratricopeptide repeat protein, partial [Thermoanaerobaculia bacterium]|nr:tetratricopeptide repeat protein [Thermoanaerobaculia bacterium]
GFRFSFEDLVFLRAASGLLKARIAPRRVRRALTRLRDRLPAGRGLTGLRIAAEGDRIVVGDGTARWQADSGQILFDFGVGELAQRVAPLARRAFREAQKEDEELSADDWYEWGCELEYTSASEALEAYRQALVLDPGHVPANVNLGRLLHERGDPAAAEQHYRRALATEPRNATAAFNLGVALEDLGREEAALEAYERAGALDPENADAQYNAANLCERLGRRAAALRHWKSYRNLGRHGRA